MPNADAEGTQVHYFTWLMDVEPLCANKAEYAALISELRWITGKESLLDPDTMLFQKALKRIAAAECLDDKYGWLEHSVDASSIGNEARFANHSDDPNSFLDGYPSLVAINRANTSLVPPGGNGAINLIGRFGYAA